GCSTARRASGWPPKRSNPATWLNSGTSSPGRPDGPAPARRLPTAPRPRRRAWSGRRDRRRPCEQPGPFGHRQGRAVHVGQADRDVPGGQAAGQLAELLGAGDVEVVVAVQDEYHGPGIPHRLLDGITHQFGVGVEQGASGRTISTSGTGTIPSWRPMSANAPGTT